MIPRYGRPPLRGQRYTLRPGAYAILPMARGVLVTHQLEPNSEIQLPGGGIDPGEHIVPALRREILEETGWLVGQVRRFGAFRRFNYMPEYDKWAEKICTIYVGSPTREVGPPTEDGHTAMVLDVHEAIEALANDGDRAMLSRAWQFGLVR